MLLRMVEETIFHSQSFWFFAFGGLIILYVIATIINRIKNPKSGVQKVQVRVKAISELRVTSEVRDAGIERMRSSSVSMSKSKFEVEFHNEEKNETFCYVVPEKEWKKMKIGGKGELLYNKSEFLHFIPEGEKEKKKIHEYVKAHKRKVILSILILFGVVLAVGVGLAFKMNKSPEQDILIDEIDDKPLVVYLVGQEAYDKKEVSDSIFQTHYLLGEFTPTASQRGQGGYIFNEALNAYAREYDQDVEITRFDNTAIMLETAYKEWKNGEGPDVIIGDYTQAEYCLYPYIDYGMFADLMPYFEIDEIYSSGEYVSNVLKAGRVNNEQFVFPLTFNMNILYTSEERQQIHEKWLNQEMTYHELIKLFTESWQEYGKNEEYLMLQFTNMFADYPYVLFQAASGENLIDYETGRVVLNKATFKEWATLYESFLCDDFNMTREELKTLVKENSGVFPVDLSTIEQFKKTASGDDGEPLLEFFELLCQDALCIAEGGNKSFHLHSFAANASYYESRFLDNEENFMCIGIPTKNSSNSYAAQITTFGVVLSNSSKIEEGYNFIKLHADTKHWMHLDVSVNRAIIEETMNDLASTYYEYYPALGLRDRSVELGHDDYGDSYQIKPMSSETKEYLLYMIDHIGSANLPEFELTMIITEEIEKYLWGDTETIEDAYDNVIKRFAELGYAK